MGLRSLVVAGETTCLPGVADAELADVLGLPERPGEPLLTHDPRIANARGMPVAVLRLGWR